VAYIHISQGGSTDWRLPILGLERVVLDGQADASWGFGCRSRSHSSSVVLPVAIHVIAHCGDVVSSKVCYVI
jgi:hypothetical protein